jgi:hypothetical protein
VRIESRTTRRAAGFVTLTLLAAAWPLALGAAPSGASATKPVTSHAAAVKAVTIGIRHRVFQQFSEVQTVRLNQEFPIGDTEYSARVVRYVPDFAMELKTGKITSRSNEPKNPAFQIIVKEGKTPQDTSWAFLNLPPHFGRKSLLAFKIVRIDYVNRASVVADTSRAESPAPVAGHPTGRKQVGTKP